MEAKYYNFPLINPSFQTRQPSINKHYDAIPTTVARPSVFLTDYPRLAADHARPYLARWWIGWDLLPDRGRGGGKSPTYLGRVRGQSRFDNIE